MSNIYPHSYNLQNQIYTLKFKYLIKFTRILVYSMSYEYKMTNHQKRIIFIHPSLMRPLYGILSSACTIWLQYVYIYCHHVQISKEYNTSCKVCIKLMCDLYIVAWAWNVSAHMLKSCYAWTTTFQYGKIFQGSKIYIDHVHKYRNATNW